jgi:hypothetical protein
MTAPSMTGASRRDAVATRRLGIGDRTKQPELLPPRPRRIPQVGQVSAVQLRHLRKFSRQDPVHDLGARGDDRTQLVAVDKFGSGGLVMAG